jgi:hypothetical protein
MESSILSKLILPGSSLYSDTTSELPPNWQSGVNDNTIFCAGIGGILRPMNFNSDEFHQYLDSECDERFAESDEWDELESMTQDRSLYPILHQQILEMKGQ